MLELLEARSKLAGGSLEAAHVQGLPQELGLAHLAGARKSDAVVVEVLEAGYAFRPSVRTTAPRTLAAQNDSS